MNKGLCNFIETNGSFSILIQLMKYKDRRSVVFLPTITFASIDLQTIELLNKKLGDKKEIIEYKQKDRKNITYKLVFQGIDDTNYILDNIMECKFESDYRIKVIKLFEKTVKELSHIGVYHTEWDNKFRKIIDLKRDINKLKRTREGYTGEEWENRIKDHLYGETELIKKTMKDIIMDKVRGVKKNGQ